MKNLKNMVAAITLAVVLMVGTANAGTGLLMSDFAGSGNQNCAQTSKDNGGIIINDSTGIIIAGGFAGIIIAGFTGIIIAGVNETPNTCGN